MATGGGGPLAAVVVLWIFVALACVPLLGYLSHPERRRGVAHRELRRER